ncbi:MAG: PAS domain-containing protein [Clostridia bacterium]|nr:PAS domain-containing protein [Clostridia bacterium]
MAAFDQESYPQRVLRDMNEAVLVLDRQGRILYANAPATRKLEMGADFVPGETRFGMNYDEEYNDDFYACVTDALFHKQEDIVHTVPYMTSSGRKYVFRMSSSYLADGPGHLVITLADETETMRLRERINESTRTFTMFLYAFCVWMIFYAFWVFMGQPFAAKHMTRGVEVLGLLMFLYISLYTKLSWRDLGLAPRNMVKTLRTAGVVALCSVAFLFALKGVIRLFKPDAFSPEAPFWDIRLFGLPQIAYIFTAGIQEFLARSVMQGNLSRILIGRHRAASAIVLSSLIFAALHIHLGFLFMVGAAILAGLEGILYQKQRSVYGVWIVHWVFGVTGTLLRLIDH